jgi:hypothetical protein
MMLRKAGEALNDAIQTKMLRVLEIPVELEDVIKEALGEIGTAFQDMLKESSVKERACNFIENTIVKRFNNLAVRQNTQHLICQGVMGKMIGVVLKDFSPSLRPLLKTAFLQVLKRGLQKHLLAPFRLAEAAWEQAKVKAVAIKTELKKLLGELGQLLPGLE